MKIRIKSGDCPIYLTVGKVYEVVGLGIIADNGRWVFVKLYLCHHLNGGSWEIVND